MENCITVLSTSFFDNICCDGEKCVTVSLTSVFNNICCDRENCYYDHTLGNCEKCCLFEKQRPEKFKFVLETLEKKKSSDFTYSKSEYNDTFEKFKLATAYSFDEDTLAWIIRKGGRQSKVIIEILMGAGIEMNVAESTLNQQFSSASDDDIYWYVFELKLGRPSNAYREYGERSDRHFEQKLHMFDMLHDQLHLKPTSITLCSCYGFSNNIDEVKYFIEWFMKKGCKFLQCHFGISFSFFGTKLFDFLLDHNVKPIDDYQSIVTNPKRSIDEKIEAIEYIHQKNPDLQCESNILSMVLRFESLELIKALVKLGANINIFLINKLLMVSNLTNPSTDSERKLSFEFVTKCLNYVLEISDIEIPHTGPNWYRYHCRINYRFDGRLYDWMVSFQPKMQQSLKRRQMYKLEVEKQNNIFFSEYGMSRETLDDLQRMARKNGQCPFYSEKNDHNNCHLWPKCNYYHGPKEECYKINKCKNNKECTENPIKCHDQHYFLASFVPEYMELAKFVSQKSTELVKKFGEEEKFFEFSKEKELAKRFNDMPWMHYVPMKHCFEGNISGSHRHYFRLLSAVCHGKTDKEDVICCSSYIRFMALNEGEVWGRYYCSFEHLQQIEGTACKWYLQEPEISWYDNSMRIY
jgi:hypothetical protein